MSLSRGAGEYPPNGSLLETDSQHSGRGQPGGDWEWLLCRGHYPFNVPAPNRTDTEHVGWALTIPIV